MGKDLSTHGWETLATIVADNTVLLLHTGDAKTIPGTYTSVYDPVRQLQMGDNSADCYCARFSIWDIAHGYFFKLPLERES